MKYIVTVSILALILRTWPVQALAAEKNVVTFVSIVRGREFWRVGKEIEFLIRQRDLLDRYGVVNTWLLQYDALLDGQARDEIDKQVDSEKGLLMEVTPKLAKASFVNYDWFSEKWERADKLFLSGYEISERKKLIDTAFEEFKKSFGYYPRSIGAWHIDGWSLQYMRDKYEVLAVLGLADQYTTDGYQVWGQYIGEPYYPGKRAVLEPAEDRNDKIDVVKLQWAPREPLLSYGPSGQNSNYSAQVNDYYRFYNLGSAYFRRLLALYTTDISGKLSQITLGLEVGELEEKYLAGLEIQLADVSAARLLTLSMHEFALLYRATYPDVSPAVELQSKIGGKTMTWYFSPIYRAGIVHEFGKSKLVDLRFYHRGRFADIDLEFPDKRQNLYRVVPGVVDKIGLGNEIDLGKSKFRFGPEGPESDVLTEEAKPTLVKQQQTSCFRQGFGGWFEDRVVGLIPDIRASKIEGGWVVGLRTGSEDLWGVRKGKVGKLRFEYPILESFLGIDKTSSRGVDAFRCKEIIAKTYEENGLVIEKNSPYGIENMRRELGGHKLYEDSYFVVRRKD